MPRRSWEIPDREATPADVYQNRRKFLRTLGGASAAGLLLGCGSESVLQPTKGTEAPPQGPPDGPPDPAPQLDRPDQNLNFDEALYPAPTNPDFSTLDRPLTNPDVAATWNNFYEFTTTKDVAPLVEKFKPHPWTVEVAGLVRQPLTYDIDHLVRLLPLEERLYRFRCVEAWAMAVPWTGFPMKAFIDLVQPLSAARYVKMTTFLRPQESPGQWIDPESPWPYTEGLTMAEATNELTLMATGIYGGELPKQHGAPIRLVVPWKYGYKSIKSIVRIEFTSAQPRTFWNDLAPHEYGFESNVDPKVPHPRWSQATERMLGTNKIRDTLLYNGYQKYVAHLYG